MSYSWQQAPGACQPNFPMMSQVVETIQISRPYSQIGQSDLIEINKAFHNNYTAPNQYSDGPGNGGFYNGNKVIIQRVRQQIVVGPNDNPACMQNGNQMFNNGQMVPCNNPNFGGYRNMQQNNGQWNGNNGQWNGNNGQWNGNNGQWNGNNGQWNGNNGQWNGNNGQWNGNNGQWNGNNNNWNGNNGQWNGNNGQWNGNNGQWNDNNGQWNGNNGQWKGDNGPRNGNNFSNRNQNYSNQRGNYRRFNNVPNRSDRRLRTRVQNNNNQFNNRFKNNNRNFNAQNNKQKKQQYSGNTQAKGSLKPPEKNPEPSNVPQNGSGSSKVESNGGQKQVVQPSTPRITRQTTRKSNPFKQNTGSPNNSFTGNNNGQQDNQRNDGIRKEQTNGDSNDNNQGRKDSSHLGRDKKFGNNRRMSLRVAAKGSSSGKNSLDYSYRYFNQLNTSSRTHARFM